MSWIWANAVIPVNCPANWGHEVPANPLNYLPPPLFFSPKERVMISSMICCINLAASHPSGSGVGYTVVSEHGGWI